MVPTVCWVSAAGDVMASNRTPSGSARPNREASWSGDVPGSGITVMRSTRPTASSSTGAARRVEHHVGRAQRHGGGVDPADASSPRCGRAVRGGPRRHHADDGDVDRAGRDLQPTRPADLQPGHRQAARVEVPPRPGPTAPALDQPPPGRVEVRRQQHAPQQAGPVGLDVPSDVEGDGLVVAAVGRGHAGHRADGPQQPVVQHGSRWPARRCRR